MGFSSKFGGVLVGGAAASGTGYAVYDSSSPKTIEQLLIWKGNKFIESENNAYKAVWAEKENEVKQLEGFSSVNDTDVVGKLKSFCDEKKVLIFDQKISDIYEKVEKFCIDKPKTVRGLLTRSGANLVKDKEDDYKVIFALYKTSDTSGFIDWIKETKTDVTNSTTNSDGANKLKEHCKSKLDQQLTEEDLLSNPDKLKKIYWWCTTPGYSDFTFEEKIKKDSRKMVDSSTNAEAFQNLWEQWKNTEAITKAVKGTSSDTFDSSTEKTKGGPKLETWCSDNKSKKLYEENLYPTTFIQFKSVCTVASS